MPESWKLLSPLSNGGTSTPALPQTALFSATIEPPSLSLLNGKNADQRSRSAKPTTIHGYAQSGNLIVFQKMLRKNTYFLNGKNAISAWPATPKRSTPFPR
ncbi:hypothetical protein C1H46_021667 [Malus baccata]|uniref:Uncharacterized protein n=1 Tax=Malus baccata TaxID=106549 RepID=A0A540M1P8_MALBA|nr:hypothetical protein C1H46_021667 [Malus baccata]